MDVVVAEQSRKVTDNDAATVNDPEDLVHHATLDFLVEQQGGILGDQLHLPGDSLIMKRGQKGLLRLPVLGLA